VIPFIRGLLDPRKAHSSSIKFVTFMPSKVHWPLDWAVLDGSSPFSWELSTDRSQPDKHVARELPTNSRTTPKEAFAGHHSYHVNEQFILRMSVIHATQSVLAVCSPTR
jgi:hypothetical protein